MSNLSSSRKPLLQSPAPSISFNRARRVGQTAMIMTKMMMVRMRVKSRNIMRQKTIISLVESILFPRLNLSIKFRFLSKESYESFSKKQPVDVFPVVVAKIEKGRQLLDLRKYLSYFRYFDKCNVFFLSYCLKFSRKQDITITEL